MLQKVPLMQSLTDNERRKIAGCLNVLEFEDSDAIVTEGEAGDAMYILQTGGAQAFVKGAPVVGYESGEFFGELALTSQQPRAATVRASGFSTTVLQLPQEDFDWLMSQKGDIKAMIEQQARSYAQYLQTGADGGLSDEADGSSSDDEGSSIDRDSDSDRESDSNSDSDTDTDTDTGSSSSSINSSSGSSETDSDGGGGSSDSSSDSDRDDGSSSGTGSDDGSSNSSGFYNM